MPEPFDDDPVLARPAPPRSPRERLEALADATGSTPARLVGGTALALAVAVAGYLLTRPPSPPPEVAIPFTSTSVVAATTTTVLEELVVHVAGAVAAPGVHRLPVGARVVDAVAAAGGLGPTADGARINLAAPVQDGERVYLPAVGEAAPAPVPGPGGASAGVSSGPLDLNTATEAQLDELPGVGPATAAAIVAHRDRIGRFTSVEQLLDVRGIGEAKLEQLRALVRV